MKDIVARLDRSPRTLLALSLAGTLVLALAVWFLAVSPKRSQASALDGTIAQAQAQLTALRAHRPAPGSVRASELPHLERALPDRTEMPSLVLQLARLAGASGVTLDTITPSVPVAVGAYEAVPMTVVVDGRFFGVRDFLRRVRSQVRLGKDGDVTASGRLFDVQAIDFQQTEPAPQVRASLTMQAFVFSGGATGSGAPPAAPTSTAPTSAAGATG